ncbi:MAG: 3'(2'),5'-bisphosphate nucleotidase CysQ [Candidatus Latescibacterota bacterium]|nr:MAG: 3'(2'),5'-bisphosphate nucleotidase CysQ [Candidatus Latescibacterota bacterium]
MMRLPGAISEDDQILARIEQALDMSGSILSDYTPGRVEATAKAGGDPVTEADLAVDAALRKLLPAAGDGWLSEESVREPQRLQERNLWVVDPIDGTKEFVSGIPEWCVSIGYVENGTAVAGGIFNPASGETILGSLRSGVWRNGERVTVSRTSVLSDAVVLASRSEVGRGEWASFMNGAVRVRPTGSVAYKLGLVAAGRADATWTLTPKSEWDVAAGVALVRAAGGEVRTLDWRTPRFNNEPPVFDGLVACNATLLQPIGELLELPAT